MGVGGGGEQGSQQSGPLQPLQPLQMSPSAASPVIVHVQTNSRNPSPQPESEKGKTPRLNRGESGCRKFQVP
jgi:hypothetical protein